MVDFFIDTESEISVNVCIRCGSLYQLEFKTCPTCIDLTDAEAEEQKNCLILTRQKHTKPTGYIFITITIILLFLLFLLS